MWPGEFLRNFCKRKMGAIFMVFSVEILRRKSATESPLANILFSSDFLEPGNSSGRPAYQQQQLSCSPTAAVVLLINQLFRKKSERSKTF